MFLKYLDLRCFRNYREQSVEFDAQKTIVLGENAQGKSNLLEAVELLSTLRSHRSTKDRELVLEGELQGQITAQLDRLYGTSQLGIVLRPHQRRSVILNHETLRRHGDLLGTLNAVQFSSLDLEIVRGSPENRRNWLDILLIQLEPIYDHILREYTRILKQRNSILKQQCKALHPDWTQVHLWDEQLARMGSRIMRRRIRVVDRITPIAQYWHNLISRHREDLQITYQPNVPLTENHPDTVYHAFLEKIETRRLPEQQQAKTLVGPHRDEVELKINQTPARSYGSQGQQRTLVLALKLAELQLIEEVINEPPLLLLDDVLAELDLYRQNQLLETIQNRFQTLITTTHLSSFDANWLKDSQVLTIANGHISNC